MKDPRREGRRYWCGYWRSGYTVIRRDDSGLVPWFTVRWDDGHETTHCTAWSRDDREMGENS